MTLGRRGGKEAREKVHLEPQEAKAATAAAAGRTGSRISGTRTGSRVCRGPATGGAEGEAEVGQDGVLGGEEAEASTR